MSFAIQTPQRPLPGAYIQTPAASKYQINAMSQPNFQSRSATAPQQYGSQPQSQAPTEQRSTNPQQVAQSQADILTPIERAAKTINETLTLDSRYPKLDNYVGQGVSSEYDVSAQPAWAPFQKATTYNIPDKIFEQYNRAQVSTMMGLFADLNHAWVSIDNAVYIWDYTHPTPDLVGFEEQPNSITAVRLVVPRSGVFSPSIQRVLVLATTADILLIGVSLDLTPGSAQPIALFDTRLSISVKGLDVSVIEGSDANGRIFFSGKGSDDVYELTYQQEERWFQNRCTKINHTSASSFAPILSFGQKPSQESVTQMVVDDTRSLLYTLSSKSTIRTFHMRPNGNLDLVITKTIRDTLTQLGHIAPQSEIISPDTTIIFISPICAQEASKLHLMATTSTGCRIFMSATSSGWGTSTDSSKPPTSMQVQHVKFPPPNTSPQGSSQVVKYGRNSNLNTSSRALVPTRTAIRYAPGYFFCFVAKDNQGTDALFVSAPDTGRIQKSSSTNMMPGYIELGQWLNLGSRAEDIGLASAPFSAAASPNGFGNELAVQYDKPASEIAILTNTGVHTMRRRRLVDIFATAIKLGGGEEGLQGEVRNFTNQYGRAETASTALAVACGQGLDATFDSRAASISEPEVLEYARKAFIEFGGKAMLKEELEHDQSIPTIGMVTPSSRHQGLSLYVTRLVRSIWKAPVVVERLSPVTGLSVSPAVSLSQLQIISRDLTKLKEFLAANKGFIEGLAGPEALGRVSTKAEEVCLQGEHRALHSLVVLIENIIEGLAFVLVLFDENIVEIVLSLASETRQQLRNLSYERLFCTSSGRELAKELVKAIVNRNIANGSNVETVAEALRRRCGSFCSADDVIIFKAQELLKKASVEGSGSEVGRNLLNESLRLFKQVAGHLSTEQLQWALHQYQAMQFYAGAIQLALTVAQELDRGNKALTWIQEGRPEQDVRANAFASRKRCYDLVHEIIAVLEQASRQTPEAVNGQYNQLSKRIAEAYEIIDTSSDEVFQTDLYDWYLAQGRTDRLLDIQSPFIVTYLQRKSSDDLAHADLLWKYHNKNARFYDAAVVQFALAKSAFPLSLDRRIEYLGRAKASASTSTPGIARGNRHALIREISDLLDVAGIQSDILQRLKEDTRIAPARKPDVLAQVNGPLLGLTDLYNSYADQAGYFDLCLLIYQAADHRNAADVRNTWQNLIEAVHGEVQDRNAAANPAGTDASAPQPWEAVAEQVRSLGNRLQLSESIFPVHDVLPLLEKYAFEWQHGVGPATWPADTLIDLNVPCEAILEVLENMFYADEAPFAGKNRRVVATEMLHVIGVWMRESLRGGGVVFGDEGRASAVSEMVGVLVGSGVLDAGMVEVGRGLRVRIESFLR